MRHTKNCPNQDDTCSRGGFHPPCTCSPTTPDTVERESWRERWHSFLEERFLSLSAIDIGELSGFIDQEIGRALREERATVPNPCYSQAEVDRQVSLAQSEGYRKGVEDSLKAGPIDKYISYPADGPECDLDQTLGFNEASREWRTALQALLDQDSHKV